MRRSIRSIAFGSVLTLGLVCLGCLGPQERNYPLELANIDKPGTKASNPEVHGYKNLLTDFSSRTTDSEDAIFDSLVFVHVNARKLLVDKGMLQIMEEISEYLDEIENDDRLGGSMIGADEDKPEFTVVATEWLTLRAE